MLLEKNRRFAHRQMQNPNYSSLYRTIAYTQYHINNTVLWGAKGIKEKFNSNAVMESIGDIFQLSRTGLGMVLCSLLSILLYQLRDSGYYRTSFDSHVAIKLRTMQKDNDASTQFLDASGKGHSNNDIRNPKLLFNFLRKIHADEYPQLIQRLIGIIASNPNNKVTERLLPIKQYMNEHYPHLLVDFSADPNSISHDYISLVGIRPRETSSHAAYENKASEYFSKNTLGRKTLNMKKGLKKSSILNFVKENGVGIFGPHYLFSGSVRIDHADPVGFGDGSSGDIVNFKDINAAYLELKKTDNNGSKDIHQNRKFVKRDKLYFLVHTDNNMHDTRKKVDQDFIENYSLKYCGEKFFQRMHKKYGYNSAALFTILQVTLLNKIPHIFSKKLKSTTSTLD